MAPDQMRHFVRPDQDPNCLPNENPGKWTVIKCTHKHMKDCNL